jgi:hypothetical protein
LLLGFRLATLGLPGRDIVNERQAKRMPMLFSPTIGAARTAAIGRGA